MFCPYVAGDVFVLVFVWGFNDEVDKKIFGLGDDYYRENDKIFFNGFGLNDHPNSLFPTTQSHSPSSPLILRREG